MQESSSELASALSYSHYATAALAARPDERPRLEATIAERFDWESAASAIATCVDDGDADALARALRTLRMRAFVHTLARDLTGRADLTEVCAAMTTLAETALRAALALHHRALAARHGEPRDADGRALELVILGMGKLGGCELNVSSDVDLIFVYPEDGETDGVRPISNR